MSRMFALIVGAALFAAGTAQPGSTWAATSGDEKAAPGPGNWSQPAPDAQFKVVGGGMESLVDYRGRLLLLNLWATWCPPCIGEIPHLVDVQEQIAPAEATIIGLAIDSGSADGILRFWRRTLDLEPAYPLWMGTMGDVEHHFGAFTLPVTLLVDRDGVIRERFFGMQTTETLLQALEPYLQ